MELELGDNNLELELREITLSEISVDFSQNGVSDDLVLRNMWTRETCACLCSPD